MATLTIQRPAASLTIGGSDSGGGAGIQADLRMFDRLGAHGCSVITALTAQNPMQVRRVEATPLPQLEAELHAVFDHYDIRAVKTGMLFDAPRVNTIARTLRQHHSGKPLVIDPVMIASSGRPLLDQTGITAVVEELLPLATLLTPNLDEAAVLLERTRVDDALEAATELALRYHCAVLLKGGHADGEQRHDFLCTREGEVHVFSHPAQSWDRDQAHGTGCRLASAIAALLAANIPLATACQRAIVMLQNDIRPQQHSTQQKLIGKHS